MLLESGLELYPIHPNDAPYIWGQVEGFIQGALDTSPSGITTDRILQDIENTDRQLWIIRDREIKAAFVTHINEFYGEAVGTIAFAGGSDAVDWIEIVDPVADWLKSQGVKRMTIVGRKGWERLLKPYGFEFEEQIIGKRL